MMGFVLASPGLTDSNLVQAPGWYWDSIGQPLKGWTLSTNNWRKLLSATTIDATQLNARWGINWTGLQWSKLWRKLWTGWGHPGTKLLLWLLLHYGFFTKSRGALWKACTATCPMCTQASEMIIHLFFNCQFVATRWRSILNTLSTTDLNFNHAQHPFHLILLAIQKQKCSPTRILLLAEILWTTWCKRNRTVFQQTAARTPISLIFFNVIVKAKALASTTRSIRKQVRLRNDISLLESKYLQPRQTHSLPPALLLDLD
jgi:hypothetical protein